MVAVTPLSTLGAEDKSVGSKKLLGRSSRRSRRYRAPRCAGLAGQRRDRQSEELGLNSAEGDSTCAAEVGKLVGAQFVTEVGGPAITRRLPQETTDVSAARCVDDLAIDAKGVWIVRSVRRCGY